MRGKGVVIIGGGLAGSEAAYQALRLGSGVTLFEMKPLRFSPAHAMEGLAELVCSNSLKSEDPLSASGLLKEEMKALGSLVMEAAIATRVPAGNALAVDRAAFSSYISGRLTSLGARIVREEVKGIPEDRPLVISTGPLTSDAFASAMDSFLGKGGGQKRLYFYDAVSPIVHAQTLDMGRAFMASRYGKGGQDYVNCPLDEREYSIFVEELVRADSVEGRSFEDAPLFEGCLPIEAMAARGVDTLRFGPMKPVGLVDPSTGRRPYAVVQLRGENREKTLYNMVGFQTRLTYPEQKRVFGLIPALRNAQFARLGKMHRNTYVDSPALLTEASELKTGPGIFFAGQITGVEGYMESAASGLVAGINGARFLKGLPPASPPGDTVMGALLRHISSAPQPFQPMNANFGLLTSGAPARSGRGGREGLLHRSLKEIERWRNEILASSAPI